MKIVPTENRQTIEQVLHHPAIYKDIAEGVPEGFKVPIGDPVTYLAGYHKGLVGIACFHPFRDGLKYHPNVLPEQRKYAHKFIRKTLEKSTVPTYVEVPERLIRLCEFHGFKEIERNTKILMRLHAKR